MSANSEQILKEALALPLQERAELVEQLLATFQSPPDPQIDELWGVKLRTVWTRTIEVNSRQFLQRRFSKESNSGVRTR